jgi:peptidyl-prolyl cis-trans isomerase SurA
MESQNGKEVLMTVGKTPVSVDEFRYIYEKNNNTQADYSEQSLSEYLGLFKKFKLKVEKARQLRLDTLPELQRELEGYRKQLASTYLMDKEVTEMLLRELFERSQTDVAFKHIFIPLDSKASQEKKDAARIKMLDIKSRIVGGMSFEEVAEKFSEDKLTSSKGGYMGYYTAKMPDGFYELETALYNTPQGDVSDIVESRIGLHLIKVEDKRPARGKISVSQILLPSSEKELADSLYNELMNGAHFRDMVKAFSTDKNTVKGGGRLSPFGINTYDPIFEEAAFSLDKVNKYSKPVLTKAGWHIIMFNEKVNPDSFDTFARRMKSQINKDQRFDIAKTQLVNDIKATSNYSENRQELSRFASQLDEEFYTYKWSPGSSVSANTLMTLGEKSYTTRDFADFCRKNTKTRLQYNKEKQLSETVDELFEEFVRTKALEYEESQLEQKYEDFRHLMREYEEGILLFEATKMNVWDRANQDTVGLVAFHSQNTEKYMKNETAVVHDFIVSGVSEKVAQKIHKSAAKMETAKLLSKYNKKSEIVSFVEKEMEKGDKDIFTSEWKSGVVSDLKTEDNDTWSFSKVSHIQPQRPKTLAEARGFIVADYQEFLEKEWMKELESEFVVKVNQDVLEKMKKNP